MYPEENILVNYAHIKLYLLCLHKNLFELFSSDIGPSTNPTRYVLNLLITGVIHKLLIIIVNKI